MSHTLTKLTANGLIAVQLTIVNYVTGGEAVVTSEVNAIAIDGVIFGTVPAGQNSLGVPLFPVLNAGKVMLFRFTAGAPVEIAATNNLNANITAIVHATGWTASNVV